MCLAGIELQFGRDLQGFEHFLRPVAVGGALPGLGKLGIASLGSLYA